MLAELTEYDPLLEVRTSLGIVRNFSQNAPGQPQEPPTATDVLLDIYRNDPILSAAIDTKIDTVFYNGHGFRSKNKQLTRDAQLKFSRLNIPAVLKNMLTQAEIMGDGFLEPKLLGDLTINEIHPLETSQMRIIYDQNGDVQGYTQKADNVAVQNWPRWEPDQILHYRAKWVGSAVYSYSPIESIARTQTTRLKSQHYILQIFNNLPPKMAYVLKQANHDQYLQFREILLGAKSNPNSDIMLRIPKGVEDLDIKQFVTDFNQGIIDLQKHLREEILIRTRVPPCLLGLSSGQARTEPAIFGYEVTVKSIQDSLASFVNQQIMPLLGLKTVEFFFNPVTILSEQNSMAIARNMIDSGLTAPENTEHPAIHFMRKKGFDLPPGTKVESPKEKDIDTMPSRQRRGNVENKNKHDQTGDSKDGELKKSKVQIRTANYTQWREENGLYNEQV